MNSSWSIPEENISKYEKIFMKLDPVNNKLEGNKIKQILQKSELSNDILSKYWELSDIDKDGMLDKDEFTLIMHLIHETIEGRSIPDPLPVNVIPPNKRYKNQSIESLLALMPSQQSQQQAVLSVAQARSVSPSYSIQSVPESITSDWPEWIISQEELNSSYVLFCQIDTDADGLISGREVKDYLNRSGLSNEILAKIWGLVDVNNSGSLNKEQFALVIYLIQSQLNRTGPLPNVLPPKLVPPSLRPVCLDDKLLESSRMLKSEIEKVQKQKFEIQQTCSTLEQEARIRMHELDNYKNKINTLENTNAQLSRQKVSAETSLGEYEAKMSFLKSQLDEMNEKINFERLQLTQTRADIADQQQSVKALESEIQPLQSQLTEIIRQESQLYKAVDEQRTRNKLVQQEINFANEYIEKKTRYIEELEKSHKLLKEFNEKSQTLPLEEVDLENIRKIDLSSIGKDVESYNSVYQLNSLSQSNAIAHQSLQPLNLIETKVSNNSDIDFNLMTNNKFKLVDNPSPTPFDAFNFAESTSPPINQPAFDPFSVPLPNVSSTNQSIDLFKKSLTDFDPFATPIQEIKQTPSAPFDPFNDLGRASKPSLTLPKDPFSMENFANSLPQTSSQPLSNDKTAPPRPPAIPLSTLIKSPKKILSETEQLKWAEKESKELAKLQSESQRQEEAELRLALQLSLQDK